MNNPKPSLKKRAVTYCIFLGTLLFAAIGPSIVTKYLGRPSSTSNFDQLANIVRIVIIAITPIVLGWIAFTAIMRRRARRLPERETPRTPSV